MSKTLASHVTVHDESGVSFTFAPGDDLPKWAREAITNPNVWEGDAPEPTEPPVTDSPAAPPATPEAPPADAASQEPPRGGPGSGEEAWRTYATSLTLDVPADAKKADIIALVDAHKAGIQE